MHGQGTAVLAQRLEDAAGDAVDLVVAEGVEADVDLVVLAHLLDVTRRAIAGAEGAEDFVTVEETRVQVVDDDLVSQLGLAGDKEVDGLAAGVAGRGVVEVLVDAGGADDALGDVIQIDVDDVPLPFLHGDFLFAEGHEEVLHQSPLEEGASGGHLTDSHACKLADGGRGAVGGGDGSAFVVVIDEDGQLVALLGRVGDVARGQQHFVAVGVGQIQPEINAPGYAQGVVFSYFHFRG